VQRDVLDRLRATPGVLSAAITAMTPLGSSTWNDEVFVDGYQPANPMDAIPWFNEVTSSYFATLETRLLAGRDFDASDVPGSRKKAIVNDAMARRFYGDASPLGKTFRTKAGDVFSDPYTIVGVVENAKYVSLRENGSPIVYLPASQNTTPSKDFTVLLRGTGEASALVAPVKKALAELQPAAMLELHTLARQVDASLQRERVLAVLSSLFGGAALLLSILGLYGVITYAVARRRNEIGVRIALGAARSRVLGMVLADVARVIAIGLVAGAAAAAASGQLVTTFLYGLAPADPRVVTLAGVVLAMVGLGAGLTPAGRAARVDPGPAWRED
jgi:predicted permease